jgi:hypothetical protein
MFDDKYMSLSSSLCSSRCYTKNQIIIIIIIILIPF